MPVLDGPFHDNVGINVSEVQQTQTTESCLQQKGQCSFYAAPPKSQPINAECVQDPTISQSMDVRSKRPVQHEAFSRSPHDVYRQRSLACPVSEERSVDRQMPLDYSQTQLASDLQVGQYQGNLYDVNWCPLALRSLTIIQRLSEHGGHLS